MSCEPHRVDIYASRHIIVITGNEERNRKISIGKGPLGLLSLAMLVTFR